MQERKKTVGGKEKHIKKKMNHRKLTLLSYQRIFIESLVSGLCSKEEGEEKRKVKGGVKSCGFKLDESRANSCSLWLCHLNQLPFSILLS